MKEPRKSTIGELLSGDTEYFVPRYQRAFDWKGQSEVSDLMRDLIDSAEARDNDNLYLGPMIFDVSEEKAAKKIEVIDGQQRLTTTLILLMALRDYARHELSDESVAQSLQKHISNSDALSADESHRLTPSPVIGKIFPLMSEYAWDGSFPNTVVVDGKRFGIKREVNRVKPIYRFCLDQIADYCQGDPKKYKNLARHLRDKTFVIRIEIEDRAEAFEVFERTNARGKGLEVADLLKNYIFSKEAEVLTDDLEQDWDEILNGFGTSPLKALKQFWTSRRGKVNARDLYRNLRAYADSMSINEFLDELQEFSEFYKAYQSDDPSLLRDWLIEIGFPKENMLIEEARRAMNVLRLFNISQAIPLIFACARALKKSEPDKKSAKKFISLLRTFEYFHFVNNKVGGRIGNESEQAYANFSKKIFDSSSFAQSEEVRQWFSNNFISEAEFVAAFQSLSYDNKPDRNVIRYVFDRIANVGVKDGQSVDLLDLKAAQHGIRPSFDIEHLAAQSLADDDTQEAYHSIGNLLVIPKQINGILSNAPFKEKMAILSKPYEFENDIKHVPSYLQEFVAKHGDADWGVPEIEERAEQIGAQSYKIATTTASYK